MYFGHWENRIQQTRLFHILYEFRLSSAQPYDVWPGKDIYKNVDGPLIAILLAIDNPQNRKINNNPAIAIFYNRI